jgi:SAM-dependent methyltransferase
VNGQKGHEHDCRPGRIADAIKWVYTAVVNDPKKGYHFDTGPDYAVERLGYAREMVADLPDSVTGPFAGVGNPLSLGHPDRGATVVDIGAGSGMDSFLAAKAVGPNGKVIAVDMTDAMLQRGRENIVKPERRDASPMLMKAPGAASEAFIIGRIVKPPLWGRDKPLVRTRIPSLC